MKKLKFPRCLMGMFLVILLSACGGQTQVTPIPGVISTSAPTQAISTDTQHPPTTSPTVTISPSPRVSDQEATEMAYPPPKQTEAYLLEQSVTAYVKTRTAMPSITPVPPTLTPTVTPTFGKLAEPLPAPLYFIDYINEGEVATMQIMRISPDGVTVAPLIQENCWMDSYSFDVAPTGQIAYICNNDLIVIDADGGNRRVLVDGSELPSFGEQEGLWMYIEQVRGLSWSPDGKKIAYFLNGVNVINAAGGSAVKVVEGADIIKGEDGYWVLAEKNTIEPRLLLPTGWTPDGRQIILVEIVNESGYMVLVDAVHTGKMGEINPMFDGIGRAGSSIYSFTSDGQILTSSGNYSEIGLWEINPKTGEANNLTEWMDAQTNSGQPPVVHFPKQAPDGRIFFFTIQDATGNEQPGWWLAFLDGKQSSYRIPEDMTLVKHFPEGSPLLWYPDASKVLINHTGQIWIFEIDTGNFIPLGVEVHALQWELR